MHRIAIIAFLVLSSTTSGAKLSLAKSIEEIAEGALPSMVSIHTYDKTGSASRSGSGFFINDHMVLTNAHVVTGAYSAEIYTASGYYDVVVVESLDTKADLAILSFGAAGETPLALNPDAELKPGQRVIAIGNPLGLENTLSDGLVSAVRMFEGHQFLQITAPISPGSSGGPLLDLDGKVIGVVVATIEDGQNLNFAVGIQTITTFLSGPLDPTPLERSGARIGWRVIAKWVVGIFVALVAFLFGGGWWILGIVIGIIIFLWFILSEAIKGLLKLLLLPFRRKRSPTSTDYEATQALGKLANDLGISRQREASGSMEASDNLRRLHCWNCGCATWFDPEYDNEITCEECGAEISIPDELRFDH